MVGGDFISSSVMCFLVLAMGFLVLHMAKVWLNGIMCLCGRKLELVEELVRGGKNFFYFPNGLFVITITLIVLSVVYDWWCTVFLGVPVDSTLLFWVWKGILYLSCGFISISYYVNKRIKLIKKLIREEEVGEDNE